MEITVGTSRSREVIDITEKIESNLGGSGIAGVFVKHTTAAVTTADLDPGTDLDYLDAIESMTPVKKWRHPHDPPHFPDHLWASFIGPGVMLPFHDGKLQLGAWQRVILIELDGPRERAIAVTILTADEER
ncbi:MAG TPA: secondary thiamine-phosphate synthase enzyme YjbQ [Candidatus Saccharimonadales bacterium]|nr:secondary thiamine-phosphate synthase enzyme YjbQ [Candidatus Saccharimonadales bacterium]